jgi:predicted dehydrogenase
VDDARAAETFKGHEKVRKYKDFRRMLDEQGNNIDAVIVSIPDFMHATAAMWCMGRGKHVYVQKPLTRTVWEARQLQEGANKYKVASQMGNQGYSNEGTRQAAEMIWAGEIGNVTEVHAWTNRPIWPQGLTQIPPPERFRKRLIGTCGSALRRNGPILPAVLIISHPSAAVSIYPKTGAVFTISAVAR